MNKHRAELKIFLCLLLLFFPIICSGCATMEPGSKSNQIWILEKSEIDKPYKVIGTVRCAGEQGELTSYAIHHLRSDARKLGGDALIDLTFKPEKRLYEAQVIRWNDQ